MDLRKLGKALLFPHIAIIALLTPISLVLLVGSMVFVGVESPVAIASYVLSAYTLTVWCFRLPNIIRFLKRLKNENKLAKRWKNDTRLRVKVSLYASFSWNALYGAFQLWLGFYHETFWFYSLGAYYVCLAVMRFFLVGHTRKYQPGERLRGELVKYRACGWVFLIMNLALTLIIFFMVYWNRTFEHHMITAIAMAAYTFTSLTLAIINVVRYRRYNSPVYSASRAISLAAALVSVLTLESTMLTTFGGEDMTAQTKKWLLGATGGAISIMIIAAAIYMIAVSTKKINQLNSEVENGQ